MRQLCVREGSFNVMANGSKAGSTSPPYGRRGHETRRHRSPASALCRRAGQTIPISWHSVRWNRRKRQRSVAAGRLVALHIPLRQCPTDGLLPVVRVRYSSSSAVLPLAYGYIPRQGRCVAVCLYVRIGRKYLQLRKDGPEGRYMSGFGFGFQFFNQCIRFQGAEGFLSALFFCSNQGNFHSVCQLV